MAWEGSEQEDLANAMEAPQEAADAVKALAAAAVPDEEPPVTEEKEFVIFNNGSAGDGDATFSFGGSHSDD
eukprot:COSAG06_NODE_52751_length_304_cov_0.570732_1_plen_70_part_10